MVEVLKVGPKDEMMKSMSFRGGGPINKDHRALLKELFNLTDGKAMLVTHPMGTRCDIRDGKGHVVSACSTNMMLASHGYSMRHTDTGELVIWRKESND